jgi:hypothetical protein
VTTELSLGDETGKKNLVVRVFSANNPEDEERSGASGSESLLESYSQFSVKQRNCE